MKRTAITEAKQALLDSPIYHQVPLHYGSAIIKGNATTSLVSSSHPERNKLEMSVHATEIRQEDGPPQRSQPVTIDLENLEMVPPIIEAPSADPGQSAKAPRGLGRLKGSRTRPRN